MSGSGCTRVCVCVCSHAYKCACHVCVWMSVCICVFTHGCSCTYEGRGNGRHCLTYLAIYLLIDRVSRCLAAHHVGEVGWVGSPRDLLVSTSQHWNYKHTFFGRKKNQGVWTHPPACLASPLLTEPSPPFLLSGFALFLFFCLFGFWFCCLDFYFHLSCSGTHTPGDIRGQGLRLPSLAVSAYTRWAVYQLWIFIF